MAWTDETEDFDPKDLRAALDKAAASVEALTPEQRVEMHRKQAADWMRWRRDAPSPADRPTRPREAP